MNAIETSGLSKSFHNMLAVQYLDLKLPEGSIYIESQCGFTTEFILNSLAQNR